MQALAHDPPDEKEDSPTAMLLEAAARASIHDPHEDRFEGSNTPTEPAADKPAAMVDETEDGARTPILTQKENEQVLRYVRCMPSSG